MDDLIKQIENNDVAIMIRRGHYPESENPIVWVVNDATEVNSKGNSNSTVHFASKDLKNALSQYIDYMVENNFYGK